jgi:hypothetical protein
MMSADAIQIYSSDEAVAQSLKQLVGKKVKVKGNPFGAITAHRHADGKSTRSAQIDEP